MDRELLFLVLLLVFAGPLAWISGAVSPRVPLHASGRMSERLRWRALWRPVLPPCAALAALSGWVVEEPEQAESVHHAYLAIAVPVAFVWLRAAGRAVLALVCARRAQGPAVVVGVLGPTVRVDVAFLRQLDGDERGAVIAHEEAHARRRDPLRIWLAQIVSDLQWPMPGARIRYAEWQAALELARDEEARLEGADGAALASAVLKSLRRKPRVEGAIATLGGSEADLIERLRRNLEAHVAVDSPPARSTTARSVALVATLLAAAFAVGLLGGEVVVTLMARASA